MDSGMYMDTDTWIQVCRTQNTSKLINYNTKIKLFRRDTQTISKALSRFPRQSLFQTLEVPALNKILLFN